MGKKEIKTRIKIQDLPKDMKVSEKEIRNIRGGAISLKNIVGRIWGWMGGNGGGDSACSSGVCGVRG